MKPNDTTERARELAGLCRPWADACPLPLAAVAGERQAVCYANPAFCRLAGKAHDELIGRTLAAAVPEMEVLQAPLDRVSRDGAPETCPEQQLPGTPARHWSCAFWPVSGADGRLLGVMVQCDDATESAQRRLRTAEMNQELLLATLRQHELTEAAETAKETLRLKAEELAASNAQLNGFNRMMVGRELRMIEMKKEIDALCLQFGQPERYGYGGGPAAVQRRPDVSAIGARAASGVPSDAASGAS